MDEPFLLPYGMADPYGAVAVSHRMAHRREQRIGRYIFRGWDYLLEVLKRARRAIAFRQRGEESRRNNVPMRKRGRTTSDLDTGLPGLIDDTRRPRVPYRHMA